MQIARWAVRQHISQPSRSPILKRMFKAGAPLALAASLGGLGAAAHAESNGTFRLPGSDTSITLGGYVKFDALLSDKSTGVDSVGDQMLSPSHGCRCAQEEPGNAARAPDAALAGDEDADEPRRPDDVCRGRLLRGPAERQRDLHQLERVPPAPCLRRARRLFGGTVLDESLQPGGVSRDAGLRRRPRRALRAAGAGALDAEARGRRVVALRGERRIGACRARPVYDVPLRQRSSPRPRRPGEDRCGARRVQRRRPRPRDPRRFRRGTGRVKRQMGRRDCCDRHRAFDRQRRSAHGPQLRKRDRPLPGWRLLPRRLCRCGGAAASRASDERLRRVPALLVADAALDARALGRRLGAACGYVRRHQQGRSLSAPEPDLAAGGQLGCRRGADPRAPGGHRRRFGQLEPPAVLRAVRLPVKRRRLVGSALALAVAAAIAVSVSVSLAARQPETAAADLMATDVTGVNWGRDFHLIGDDGAPHELAEFRGKVIALYFGYTRCPDACPLTLATLAESVRLLGEDGKHVQVIFATVDPKHDKPKSLRQYVRSFHEGFLALYGNAAATPSTAGGF